MKEAKRRLDDAQKAYKRRVKEARDALTGAERSYEQSVRDARRQLQDAQKEYDKRVQAAETRVEDKRRGQVLGSYGAVTLFDNRLDTPDGVAPLSPEIKATVESSGELTNKGDTRELYLTLDTPKYQTVVQCNPGDSGAVRELSAAINTAAKNAKEQVRKHNTRKEEAEALLADARDDRSAIQAAQAQLTEAERDTAAVEFAREALTRAEADTSEIDARGAEVLALDPTAKIGAPKLPRRSPFTPIGSWWGRRSKKAKVGIIVLAVLVALTVLGALIPADDGEQPASQPSPPPAAAPQPEPPPPEAEPPPPPPPPLGEQVTDVVHDELGDDGPGDLPRVRSVDCVRRACTVEYNVDTPVSRPEREIMGDQRGVFKRLFNDLNVRAATLVPYGELTSVGGKTSREPVMRITCDRAANDQIDWDNVDHDGMKALCDYVPLINF